MKSFNRVLRGALMAALLVLCFAVAVGNDMIPSTQVKLFIDRNNLADQISSRSEILIAKGHTIRWSDAYVGETWTTDASSIWQIKVKIIVIPFTKASDISASIIGGIIESDDGSRIQEFIDSIELNRRSGPRLEVAISKQSEIDDYIRLIIAGDDRRAIFDLILRQITDSGIADDQVRAISIRAAFERRGYSCTTPPKSFALNSIWYAATCISATH